jgi:hypothetical protein
MNRSNFIAAAAFAAGMAIGTSAMAEGLTDNHDGTFSGFPIFIHVGRVCDAVQIYGNGPQYFGVFKDFPSKVTQAEALLHAMINNLTMKFRPTGRLIECRDALGDVKEITAIGIGKGQ